MGDTVQQGHGCLQTTVHVIIGKSAPLLYKAYKCCVHMLAHSMYKHANTFSMLHPTVYTNNP